MNTQDNTEYLGSRQTARAGGVRMAAAVLFCSGLLIGGTLGRLSTWLLPSQIASPSPPVGQVSRALQPPDIVATPAREQAHPQPEQQANANAPQDVPTKHSSATSVEKPETPAVSQEPAAPTPPAVTLLNPDAGQPESVNERPSRRAGAVRDEAVARDDVPRRRRDRRATSRSNDDDERRWRERESQRDYRSLRKEMMRR